MFPGSERSERNAGCCSRASEVRLDGGEILPVTFRLARDEETLVGSRPLGGAELVVGPVEKDRYLLFTYGPRYEAKLRALDRSALQRPR